MNSNIEEGLLEKNPFYRFETPIKAGSFLLYPVLTLEGRYTDNVLATANDTQPDFSVSTKPQLIIEKNLGRHKFDLNINAEAERFAKTTSENEENYDVKFKGLLEAKQDLLFPITAQYTIDHQDRRDSSTAILTENRLEQERAYFSGGVIYRPNRLRLQFVGSYAALRFENDTLRSNGNTYFREDSNRNVIKAEATASYQMRPNFTPFISVTHQQEKFLKRQRTTTGFNGRDNSNTLLRTFLGTRIDYKDLIGGRIALGYDMRDYEEAEDDQNLSAYLNLDWNISPRSTLFLDASRISTTDNEIVSGLVRSSLGIDYQYEIKRDLFFNANAGYSLLEFNTGDREDTITDFGVGLKYISGPRWRLGLDYQFNDRTSDVSAVEQTENLILLQLIGAL